MPKSMDLLLEHRQEGRKTWAIRFYRDGLVKEFTDSRMEFENGQIVTHSLPLAWRKLTQLSPAELEKFIAVLREADFFSLPLEIGASNKVMDATHYIWMLNLDGKQKTVRALGSQAADNPILKKFSALIQDVTADSFHRTAGEEGRK
jgi:hypothetical protein